MMNLTPPKKKVRCAFTVEPIFTSADPFADATLPTEKGELEFG